MLESPLVPHFKNDSELHYSIDISHKTQAPIVPRNFLRPSDNTSWVAIDVQLPARPVTIEDIEQVWNVVATHNDVLRTSIISIGDQNLLALTNETPKPLVTDHPRDSCSEIESAHIIVRDSGQGLSVTLHVLESLIDETSIRHIEHDLAVAHAGAALVRRRPFADYVMDVGSRDVESARQYWQSRLRGIQPDRNLLPAATSNLQATQQPRSDLSVDLGRDLFNSVHLLSEGLGIDMSLILQAAWAVVISGHQNRENIIFAVTCRDRSAPADISAVIGKTTFTFPVCVNITPDHSISALLQNLREQQVNGEQYGFIGFKDILAQWENGRIDSVIKICDRSPNSLCSIGDDDFPLTLRFSLQGSLRLTIRYDTVLGESRIRIVVQHLATALHSLTAGALSLPITQINILPSSELAVLLDKAVPLTSASNTLVHCLVERRAIVSPDAIAIEEFESKKTLSFAQLNSLANIVANQLPRGPNIIIPVCLERSALLIVALLAVLKASCTYVILDPEYPKQRLDYILKDVNAPFVLTSKSLFPLFSADVKDLDSMLDLPRGISDQNLENLSSPHDNAYIVYTSGSSGHPKGVVLTHGAASTGLLSACPPSNVRSLLFFNPVFSAAQRTIWSTLVHGGSLCIASKESLMSNLSTVITELDVNTIGVTTTTAALLHPKDTPSLRTMTLTGEKVSQSVVDSWSEAVDLRSGYGLSECTQLNWATKLTKGQPPNKIDRPTDSTSAYILNPNTLTVSPMLVPGELCLSGPQLARGYLNLPEITARSFVENPFGPGRLYRTGDLAMYHEDGSIEILGRIDRQVKVAGQRVDPGEIEVTLVQHFSVKTAVVTPITLAGLVTLVACLVPKERHTNRSDFESLRDHAVKNLPSFAVPSYWILYSDSDLPLTSTGKIDYSSLRNDLGRLTRNEILTRNIFSLLQNTVEPVTTAEKQLVSACSKLLDLPENELSIENSFVMLGGGSLQAIQLCNELRCMGWFIGVTDIIRSKSLRDLGNSLVKMGQLECNNPEPFSMVDLQVLGDDSVDWKSFDDVYPASPLQQALVAASLGGNPDYLYQRIYDVDGANITVLKSSLESVFQSDTILRTTFILSSATIVQAVLPSNHSFPWRESELTLDAFKEEDAVLGVQPGEPFWRVAYLPRLKLLVISSHHALFDFWSNSFALDDAASIYHNQTPVARPAFSNFIGHLLSNNQEQSKTFWQQYLQDAPPSNINIPVPESTAVTRFYSDDHRTFQSTHSVTFGSIVYSAWGLMLSGQVRSDDVTFATTLSGRDAAVDQVSMMNGPTLTTMPQRIRVQRDSSASEWVQAVNASLWTMIEHSQFGMRDALHVSNQNSQLFNTMVNIIMEKEPVPTTSQLFKQHGDKPIWKTEYITLEVTPDDGQVKFTLISALEPKRANFIIDQFLNAFDSLIRYPETKISNVFLMSPAEIDLLRSRASYTEAANVLLHSQLEKVAERSPLRPALQWEKDYPITYRELNNRANQLAHYLRARGVQPDDLIPLCVDKSIEMIVAIYGVLKSGAGYVPLDPENPAERNQFICKDVSAKLVITFSEYASVFQCTGKEVILIDRINFAGHWPNVEHYDLTPDNLAYAIYTSGSTGMPKGCLVSHKSVASLVKSRIEVEGYQSHWRTLLFPNYVFDVSAGDIFTVLSTGGTLCLAPMSSLLTNLAECINTMSANHISLTPTVARLLNPADVPNLTHMVLGGEPMSAELIASFAPRMSLFNGYGPTEAAIYATWARMDEGKNARIIGKPMSTVGALVLAPNTLELVPYGAIGELCVVGPQVARGYLNRPEVTAKSFVQWEGQTMYRTGDLVRWLPNGELECFGRQDNQVKIAGHRMELGEIEHAVTSTEIARDNCVVVLKVAGKPQLAAFVLMGAANRDSENVLLAAGSYAEEIAKMKTSTSLSSLPPYMVPKIWIPVAYFPLMPSGKVNRRLLTSMGNELSVLQLAEYSTTEATEGPYVTPETETEILLQSLWADILSVNKESIGATSSFFNFGGDSISAISLVSRCRRGGYELSVGDVLAFPILRDMAAKTEILASSGEGDKIVYTASQELYQKLATAGVGKEDIEAIIPAGPGQVEFLNLAERKEKFWLLQTVRELPHDLDFDRWIEVTEQLTARNPILRTSFVRDENERWVQVILASPTPRISIVNVADEEEMKRKVQEEWDEEFGLGQPGARYCLVLLLDGRRFLVHRFSHAAYDGTSLRVLDSQFKALARGEDPLVPVNFESFVAYAEGQSRSKLLDYWTRKIGDSKFSYPSSNVSSPACNALTIVKVDNSIDGYAPQYGVTVPIVYQTAFSLLLSKLANTTDISFDNLVTGRDVPIEGTDAMSGACATFLPFRVKFDTQTPLKQLLKDTQSIFWETNQHGNIPVMDIYRHFGKEDTAQNKCLFLFQPFEPAPPSAKPDHMRYCVMALSKVRQEMNYALMLEIFKVSNGYALRLRYDRRIYSEDEIEGMGKQLVRIVESMMKNGDENVGIVLQD